MKQVFNIIAIVANLAIIAGLAKDTYDRATKPKHPLTNIYD